jgi:leader peptidase (prepilin peptidase) / N-methyltransferase
VVGAALGSFLNVAILRWPAEESVIRPRSRCPGCGTPIAWYDNIPILSWLILRGRCRACAQGISIQYPGRAGRGADWLGMALWQGPGLEAVRGAMLFTILLGIAIIDARHRIIPDQLSLGGALIWGWPRRVARRLPVPGRRWSAPWRPMASCGW